MITYQLNLGGVDWEMLKADLIADDFHNGRTTDQLRLSFENSAVVAIGFDGDRCIANGRPALRWGRQRLYGRYLDPQRLRRPWYRHNHC